MRRNRCCRACSSGRARKPCLRAFAGRRSRRRPRRYRRGIGDLPVDRSAVAAAASLSASAGDARSAAFGSLLEYTERQEYTRLRSRLNDVFGLGVLARLMDDGAGFTEDCAFAFALELEAHVIRAAE